MEGPVYDRSGIREIDFNDGHSSTVYYNDGGSLTGMVVGPLRERDWSMPERKEFTERMNREELERKVEPYKP